MAAPVPAVRELLLVGGGHTHVIVLRMLGMAPIPGVRVTVIARESMAPYSGMLPGYIAGFYSYEECHIDLQRLCAWAGARLVRAEAAGIDLARRRVSLSGGERPDLPYDVLSLDIGLTPAAEVVPGAGRYATKVKPIAGFAARWEQLLARAVRPPAAGPSREDGPSGAGISPLRVAVVGGGAGGVELALAMRTRLTAEMESAGRPASATELHLVTRDRLLPSHPPRLRAIFRDALAAAGVTLHEHAGVAAVEPEGLTLSDGRKLPAEEVVWCTEGRGAPWLAASGLQVDAAGFVCVGADLSAPGQDGRVFAAGDVAAVGPHPRPKAGVFAVRQGPPLAANLRAALEGRPLRPFTPQSRFLSLVTLGGREAVASWGPLVLGGPGWLGSQLWRWKDRIDRAFMDRFSSALPVMRAPPLPTVDAASAGGPEALAALAAARMRCGGCGSKVGATTLGRVLATLRAGGHLPTRPEVTVGLDSPDDAAVTMLPQGASGVHTLDFFRAVCADPYLFGRVAAVHALGDCWAMGAEPVSALVLAVVPYGPEGMMEADLTQLVAGAARELRAAGCALAGGHSAEGEPGSRPGAGLAMGLSVHGMLRAGQPPLRKGGLRPGDLLLLTKPLGTGTVLAADMRGRAAAAWVDAAFSNMTQGSGTAADILVAAGASACTDVTGFGLLGHAVEMARASACGLRLTPSAMPALPGALDCLRAGLASSLQPANVRLARAISNLPSAAPTRTSFEAAPPASLPPRVALLFDPQTAGGLLAAVPAAAAPAALRALAAAGYARACVVGRAVALGTEGTCEDTPIALDGDLADDVADGPSCIAASANKKRD